MFIVISDITIMSSVNQEKTIYYFDEDPGYENIQKITDGYFRVMNTIDDRSVFMNESGKYTHNLNEQASNMFGLKIYGNIAIIGKTK
jgi:hypothetical protein|tara:strand:- start:152 stop:412 length:261 start_codon:yes stop_codon:yes gene_type:complete